MTHDSCRGLIGSPQSLRALARLHRRRVNYSDTERPGGDDDLGDWKADSYRQPLPSESPGPPEPGGSWEIAQRIIADYEFADPKLVRAIYHSESQLEGRDMLLVGRFFGLRLHLGVRVGGVVDEQTSVDGRPVRIWGWDYKTLQGHLEAGQMDYEVWKWIDTGEVEFRMRRYFRTAAIPNPVVRLGWRLFGRWMQNKFVRSACDRMNRFVRHELGLSQDRPPPRRRRPRL